jgi:hypothetical protein
MAPTTATQTQPANHEHEEREPIDVAFASKTRADCELPWMRTWLAVFEKSGQVQVACDTVGISRARVYQCKQQHPVFAECWAEIRECVADQLEASAVAKALGGDSIMNMWLLKCLRPQVFSDSLELRHTGVVEHRHGVIDGQEPRQIDATRRHEAVRLLRGLPAGDEVIEGSEAA